MIKTSCVRSLLFMVSGFALPFFLAVSLPGQVAAKYSADFSTLKLGEAPSDWADFGVARVNANWVRDGKGFLRVVNKVTKDEKGLLVYPANAKDGSITATFKKTPDDGVYFALVGRFKDARNYYMVRFSGDARLTLLKVKDGQEVGLMDMPTRNRYAEGEVWTLSLEASGNIVTGKIFDAKGMMQERVDAMDKDFAMGAFGLAAGNFAGVKSVEIVSANPLKPAGVAARETLKVLAPVELANVEKYNTEFSAAADAYDIVVAGAGTSGWAAAVQAARMGSKVLLIEETDWIGGQMSAAAVTTMDEEGCWEKFPVRERGLYREFHESVVNFYQTMDKDPFRAYYAWPEQLEGGYEPKVSRAVLYAFVDDARKSGATLDLCTRTKVAEVVKNGNTVTGVVIENGGAKKTVRCKVLVDATEYGDVLPLAGARYRVASTTSDKLDAEARDPIVRQARLLAKTLIAEKDVFERVLKQGGGLVRNDPGAMKIVKQYAAALRRDGKTAAADMLAAADAKVFQALLNSILQYHTWCGVIREYPEGVPEHLQIKRPPPGYDANKYKNSQLHGALIWGSPARGVKGPRTYRVQFAWRGMADSDSPSTGALTLHRHTQCGLNGGDQDYPVTVDAIENIAERRLAEREGVYRTLSKIYYYQQELGLPWAIAEDEGYDTTANRELMKQMGIRADLYELAAKLPQHPYAREARRIMGVYTLRAMDLTRWEKAKHFPTSVAMGDYFMDLDHGPTGHAVEKDLDGDVSVSAHEDGLKQANSLPRGGGPFQVPFEVFIPEKIDGLIPAEKNISQSRIVNGATRLQPITMLDGQAAGAIAALAVGEKIQPRQLNPIRVQDALLKSGANLIQRWYEDAPWGTELWRATQLLALHKVMDRPGSFNKVRYQSVGTGNFWGADEELGAAEYKAAITRLAALSGRQAAAVGKEIPKTQKRGDFSIAAAAYLVANCKPDWKP